MGSYLSERERIILLFFFESYCTALRCWVSRVVALTVQLYCCWFVKFFAGYCFDYLFHCTALLSEDSSQTFYVKSWLNFTGEIYLKNFSCTHCSSCFADGFCKTELHGLLNFTSFLFMFPEI